jgi:hypothetical protein
MTVIVHQNGYLYLRNTVRKTATRFEHLSGCFDPIMFSKSTQTRITLHAVFFVGLGIVFVSLAPKLDVWQFLVRRYGRSSLWPPGIWWKEQQRQATRP